MSEKMEFSTGAHRSSSKGRGNFDSIPQIGLERLALRCEFGDELHGKNNWKKGIPISSYANSALRHLNNYLSGNMDEDHLSAVGWNVLAMASTENMILDGTLPDSLDDIGNVLKAKRELEKYVRGNREGDIEGTEESDSGPAIAGGSMQQDCGTDGPELQNCSQVVQESQQDNWAQSWGHQPILTSQVGETDYFPLEGSNFREFEGSGPDLETDSSPM
jgi:hypothetical protein